MNTATDLVAQLSPDAYVNRQAPPYFASVGGHVRHVLDVFDAILQGLRDGTVIDLSYRRRDKAIETEPNTALVAIHITAHSLGCLASRSGEERILVCDDFGNGKVRFPCTLAGVLCQAQSHAIHHFACIGYILGHLGIELQIEGFGHNPTSPRPPSRADVAKDVQATDSRERTDKSKALKANPSRGRTKYARESSNRQ